MTMTTRKNPQVKGLQTHLSKAKKWNGIEALEHAMACNTNAARGQVWNQYDILNHYDMYGENSSGCSKAVHLHSHDGRAFENIVIKRHQKYGWMPDASDEHSKCTGNQLIDEINCWNEFAELPQADYLCPILKYFTSKSDQVEATSETMRHNVIIIAQKAVYVSNLKNACLEAQELNEQDGLIGENAQERFEKMRNFAANQGWRDAVRNPGNSGVIYDYSKNCYKAVFIDYAL